MIWPPLSHRLSPSTDPASARNERFFDLSLHALITVVSITLIACVGFLAWRWIYPALPPSPEVAVKAVSPPVSAIATEVRPEPAPGAEVLVKPGQMYRCERLGRVSFSDRPCAEGLSRVMNLPEEK